MNDYGIHLYAAINTMVSGTIVRGVSLTSGVEGEGIVNCPFIHCAIETGLSCGGQCPN